MAFLSNFINGLSLGSVYAIIALGYTMVYGIAKMLNFAHGDVIMIGAYVSFVSITSLGTPPLLALVIAMLVCTGLGMLVERLAYKPLRSATSLAVLITPESGTAHLVAEYGRLSVHRELRLHSTL